MSQIQDCVQLYIPGKSVGTFQMHLIFFFYRYLCTGDSYHTIGHSYRVGFSTVKGIVFKTCQALWDALQPELMPVPDENLWRGIAQRFNTKWNSLIVWVQLMANMS